MNYSVAIRTLGTSPATLRLELESLHRQTVMPDKIVIYIAEGYTRPDFTVGIEQYIPVKKGMVAQRALDYREIDSEYILLLDDDVEFEAGAVARLLEIIKRENASCVACDTFQNHKMSVSNKLKAAIGSLVFPHFNQHWAFKMHANGSFSYIAHPRRPYYPSMSAAGPAAMWHKSALTSLRLHDELWLDTLGFAYGDDVLEFYKLHVNGGKLLVAFDCGLSNLDAKSASNIHHSEAVKFRRIGKAQKILWHRMIYTPSDRSCKYRSLAAYKFKELWTTALLTILSVTSKYRHARQEYLAGIREANSFINSNQYRQLPSYRIF